MQKAGGRILVVDDDPEQRAALARMITALGYQTETAADGVEALEKLEEFPAHVVVTDLVMPRLDGRGLLERMQAQGGGPPAIVLTAYGSLEQAVSTVKELGAFWYLEKPVELAELSVLLERAAAQSRLKEETELLERQLRYQGVFGEMVGRSPAMQQVFALVRQIAEQKLPDLNTTDIEAAIRTIEGAARSMGIEIVD